METTEFKKGDSFTMKGDKYTKMTILYLYTRKEDGEKMAKVRKYAGNYYDCRHDIAVYLIPHIYNRTEK